MAVTIPTIQEKYDEILNDVATEFGVDVADLGITYKVPAKVQAALLYLAYLSLSGVQKNTWYDLAEESELIRYGTIILGRTPSPAESGEYTLEITGTIGAVVTAGTQFRADDDTLAAGSIFVVDADYTLIAETDSLPVRAAVPGLDSALFVDDLLTSIAPIVNVDSSAKVTAITIQPTANEDIESYRADVVQRARIEPQGGSPGDYRLWSLEVPEVRTTYPYAKTGSPGDIEIYVEATKENTAPAEITGVPTQATIDEVYKPANAIDPETGVVVINPVTLKGRKPIGVFNVYALPVNPIPIDINFINLSDESIATTLKTSIDDLLYNIRPFVAGADITANKNDTLTIGQIISVVISILTGTGITYTTLTMDVDSVELTENQFLLGDYPYLRFVNNNASPI